MPLPKGYTLDSSGPKLPAGYTLDAAEDTSRPAGLPAGVSLPQLAPRAPISMQPSLLGRDNEMTLPVQTIANVAKGAIKGATRTGENIIGMANKRLPQGIIPGDAMYAASQDKPVGTAQKIGSGIEQAGEFLIPGGIEEKGAAYGAGALRRIPMLSGAAPTLARLGASAIGAGTVNKTQGGDFDTGAAAGAAGAGIGMGLKAIASPIAETALRIRGTDRAYGANPGRAILEETTGIRPGKISDSAREKMNLLNDEATDIATRSPQSVSLAPTRLGVQDSAATAAARNNKGAIKDIGELSDQVNKEYGTKAAIPMDVPALRAVQLKRGLGDLANFSPSVRSDFADAAVGKAYHDLGNSINDVVPEIRPLNSRMQDLIPVIKRASAADLNAGFLQRMSGRLTAHTGALIGGAAGYHLGGIPGAIMGVAGPEILGSPEFQMGVARIASSPNTLRRLPVAVGAGLQLDREK